MMSPIVQISCLVGFSKTDDLCDFVLLHPIRCQDIQTDSSMASRDIIATDGYNGIFLQMVQCWMDETDI